MTDERCRICGEVLHPTQDGFYVAVNGCSVCHGKLWTPAELALARATAAKREAELLAELESWRSVASKASAEVIAAAARVAEAVEPWREVLAECRDAITGALLGAAGWNCDCGEQCPNHNNALKDALAAARALLDKAGP